MDDDTMQPGCNPLAGIQVFHTRCRSVARTQSTHGGCNPLAGIQVFHTDNPASVSRSISRPSGL